MHTVAEQPRLLRLSVAAERLDTSVATLRRRITDGSLPAVRLGPTDRHPLRIREDDIEAWLEESRVFPLSAVGPGEVRQSSPPALAGRKGERDGTSS
jgi:excisionase family DNA binding protein